MAQVQCLINVREGGKRYAPGDVIKRVNQERADYLVGIKAATIIEAPEKPKQDPPAEPPVEPPVTGGEPNADKNPD